MFNLAHFFSVIWYSTFLNTTLKFSTYLDMSVDQPVQFDIVIILTEWVDQDFCDFQPSNVENKLKIYTC